MSGLDSKSTTQVSEKRRKLLKASAATPLVATLTSGVAQANTSAFQCIDDAPPTTQPFVAGTASDGAVRVQATMYSNGTEMYYLIDSTIYDASGNIVNPDLTGFIATEGEALMVYEPSPDGTTVTAIAPWPQGQFSGVNQPLYTSCLTSVITTNINPIKGNIV